MALAEFRDVLSVDKEKLYSVIVKYEDYPHFVEGCKAVQVEKVSDLVKRVHYRVNVMSQDVNYTLDHKEDPQGGRVEWELVDSNFFKKNSGRWEIKAVSDGKTDVVYQLDMEFKIPVPGFILNRLVKGSLPAMIKNFENQAKQQ